ncbi:uncharacterized protein PpBr36_09334 [Pyricularia pennisetigena]|uniref:uncharacterized protein n=1 Tax=Pyricularia pennisetigena TaxID=1578925 RepID=UPI001153C80D|nr:uncharacterized protein PpBr36_09334 [Pyricularia pennisetigena]TLS22091.1 hypothetical protein PpBr36_09334 [Pyricularia pennisetigena]
MDRAEIRHETNMPGKAGGVQDGKLGGQFGEGEGVVRDTGVYPAAPAMQGSGMDQSKFHNGPFERPGRIIGLVCISSM